MTQTSVSDLQGIRYSIIVPAYNEEAGPPIVVRQLPEALHESYEIIVVDDDSSDGTWRSPRTSAAASSRDWPSSSDASGRRCLAPGRRSHAPVPTPS